MDDGRTANTRYDTSTKELQFQFSHVKTPFGISLQKNPDNRLNASLVIELLRKAAAQTSSLSLQQLFWS